MGSRRGALVLVVAIVACLRLRPSFITHKECLPRAPLLSDSLAPAQRSGCRGAFSIRSGVHSARGGIWKPTEYEIATEFASKNVSDGIKWRADGIRLALSAARAAPGADCAAGVDNSGLARRSLVKTVMTENSQASTSLYLELDAAPAASSLGKLYRFVPRLHGQLGKKGKLPVLLMEDISAPYRCANWIESKLVDNSSRLHMQTAHDEHSCAETVRLHNDTAQSLSRKVLPADPRAARQLARFAQERISALAAELGRQRDLCFHDASVIVVHEGCPSSADGGLRAGVHLIDLDKLTRCSDVRRALSESDPQRQKRRLRFLKHFERACTYCEQFTTPWLESLARQFESIV